MSEDQKVEIEDLGNRSNYFSQIPNIIHHMGLGCYVVAYYCLLKAIAEEDKTCFMSQSKIASMLGCSKRQIRNMNDFMEKPFACLNGKSLIKIKRRSLPNGEKQTNVIQIVDIWEENILSMKDRNSIPKTPMHVKKTDKKEKEGREPSSPGREPSSPGREPGADKEEPYKNNPLRRTPSYESSSSERTSSASSVAYGDDDDLETDSIRFIRTNGKQDKISQSEVYRYFLRKPFSTQTIKEAIKRFKDVTGPVNNVLRYLEETCNSIVNQSPSKISKKTEKQEKKPEKQKTQEETITFEEYFKCTNQANPFHWARH